MSELELIEACIKNDKTAKKQFFELYYGKLLFIANRYSKNATQAKLIANEGFLAVLLNLQQYKKLNSSVDDFVKNIFISHTIAFIKTIRHEYYVASTIKASVQEDKSYDLFLDSYLVDFKTIDQPILLKSLQELVPSQRLLFNLYVVDGYDMDQISSLLDTNEQTIKSNLEKARFNLQKTIEKNIKKAKYEQSL